MELENNFNIEDFLNMNNEDILKENNGKKFDIVLMNPPFNGSIPCKFLERMISCSNKVISIQPYNFLCGNTKTKNKYKESICNHIFDIEIIKIRDAKYLFNISGTNDLVIFICDEHGGYDYESLSYDNDSIIKKIKDYVQYNKCPIEFNKKDGYRLRVNTMTYGHSGGSGDRGPILINVPIKDIVFIDGKYNNKWWYEYYQRNQYSKTNENITASISFDNEKEAHNFYKSICSKVSRYYIDKVIISRAIPDICIIWMGNAKHPKTGEIGYKSEWTDEDFNKFFKLTDEEIKQYKDYIKDFEERRNKWLEEHKKKR